MESLRVHDVGPARRLTTPSCTRQGRHPTLQGRQDRQVEGSLRSLPLLEQSRRDHSRTKGRRERMPPLQAESLCCRFAAFGAFRRIREHTYRLASFDTTQIRGSLTMNSRRGFSSRRPDGSIVRFRPRPKAKHSRVSSRYPSLTRIVLRAATAASARGRLSVQQPQSSAAHRKSKPERGCRSTVRRSLTADDAVSRSTRIVRQSLTYSFDKQ